MWSPLLFSGYLTATESAPTGTRIRASPRIPNREVRGAFEAMFADWLGYPLGSDADVHAQQRALLRADAEAMQSYLPRVLLEHMSYHDMNRSAGERVYHASSSVCSSASEPTTGPAATGSPASAAPTCC